MTVIGATRPRPGYKLNSIRKLFVWIYSSSTFNNNPLFVCKVIIMIIKLSTEKLNNGLMLRYPYFIILIISKTWLCFVAMEKALAKIHTDSNHPDGQEAEDKYNGQVTRGVPRFGNPDQGSDKQKGD